MPFQTVVNLQPAPAVEGDFASADPYNSVLAGPGALVAGPQGLTVGRFSWVDATRTYAGNVQVGAAAPDGFVHRGSNPTFITIYLAETTMLVQPGFGVTLHSAGAFWAKTSTVTTFGQKVFANTATGAACTGAAGATIAGFVETKWFCHTVQNAGELMKISTIQPT
jgi:hypothetical protein